MNTKLTIKTYWNPKKGESKRLLLSHFQTTKMIDPTSGRIIEVESVVFLQKSDNKLEPIWNCSPLLINLCKMGLKHLSKPVAVTYINSYNRTWLINELILIES